MRELPILFSAPMVRAILALLKWMTRRGVNRLLGFGKITEFGRSDTPGYDWKFRDRRGLWNEISHERLLAGCPYGQPGDRLWVRETWQPDPPSDNNAWDDHTDTYFSWAGCGSRIDGVPPALRAPEHCIYREGWEGSALKWRPAIHMPRWASRLTLEVTKVRVERLQDISETDAKAEGAEATGYMATLGREHIAGFRLIWEHINGTGSWDANPWVWVVEFKRMEIGAA